jgi:hypothetical protein
MGLGNNMSVGKAKGKSKTIFRKRQRQIKAAENYTTFSVSITESSIINACAISNSDINITCFHNSSHASNLPLNVGDRIYTRKRASNDFALKDGFYKVGPDSKSRTYSVQVHGGAGQVSAVNTCP